MTYSLDKDLEILKGHDIELDKWIEIDNELYHSTPGISASGLKVIDSQCPSVYKHGKDHANDKSKSEAMMLGTAIHEFILENDTFGDRYLIAPTSKKTDREYKSFIIKNEEAIKEFGKIVLRKSDGDMLNGILKSLRDGSSKGGINTYDGIIINKNTEREKALYTIDKERGIILKVKADISMDGRFFDLKSTKSAIRETFMKDAANMGYGIQAAFYIYTVTKAKLDARMFGFIAVEKTPPYIHSVIVMDQSDIALETVKVNSLLDTYASCMHSGMWYGPNGISEKTKIEPLFVIEKMPAWHRYKLEESQNFKGA